MMTAPADTKRLTCPACGRFLCAADGTYVDCAPCKGCGAQTTVDLSKVNARSLVRRAESGRLELK